MRVERLTPDLLDDWLAYFDHDAFADNADWEGCYCCFFHMDEDAWGQTTPERNRALAAELVTKGELNGYLAYSDEGQPVGWCQAAPFLSIPNLACDRELLSDDAGLVGSIVCFNVAAACRKQGVAAVLLEAACDGFRAAGLHIAEAYPRPEAEGDAANYHGPLALYLRAGFKPRRQLVNLTIVRKALTNGEE